MQSVPQAPFKYLRETLKDKAFRASQFKMLHKLIYTKKLLHICRLVDTNLCERCINEIEDSTCSKAAMLLLVKCYDNKMVKLPVFLFRNASMQLSNNNKKKEV